MVNNFPHESESHPYNDVHRFFDFSPDLFGITGFDGFLKRVNFAWENSLGYTTAELLSRSINDLIHPDDRSSHTLRREPTKAGTSINKFESRMVSKDGSIKWFEWTAYPYPEQQVNYIVGRDMTERKQAQDALHQNQEAMRGLLNGMPSLALLMQPDGIILMANDLQVAGFGMPLEELIGKNIYDLTPLDNEMMRQRRAFAKEAIASGMPIVLEIERDNHYFETTLTPIRSESGEVTAVVISGHDITHLKQTEAKLRQSEQTLREFINALPGETVVTDLEGRLISFNEAFAKRYHKPDVELESQNIYSLLSPINAERRKPYSQVVVESGKPVRFQSESQGHFFDVTIFPIFDTQRRVIRLGSFVQDVTDFKQAEEALHQSEQTLRHSEEQFRSVVEAAAEGVLLTDRAGQIIFLNHRAEVMFGYTRDELLHQPIEILLPDNQRHEHIQQRHTYVQEPQSRPMGIGLDVYGKRKDGSLIPVEISLSFLHHNDEFRVMSLVTDITERKLIEQERLQQQRQQLELQQEREILELRQRFMSMVSHEFRTPLTIIASSCELLEHYYDRLPKERQIEKLQIINGQVRAMVGLLDDILQLGKIQAGAVDFVPEILDLAALCNHVLSTIQLVDQQHHQLQMQLSNFVPPVKADRRMLEHAVGNLLSNAVKYSPPGSQIAFSLSGQGEQIRMEIRDEGIGIPLADQPHLFEPFYRAQNARQIEGTGLGLAIVKHNIEKHGGTISCHSVEGSGTTFTIDLPIAAAV